MSGITCTGPATVPQATGAHQPPAPVPDELRIVLADDAEPVLVALSELIADEPGLSVVAVAASGREAIDAVLSHRPDITVMDMRMPDIDGLRAAAAIVEVWPEARIVMHSAYDDPSLVEEAYRLGAVGYIVKSRNPNQLIDYLLGLAPPQVSP